MIHSAKSRIGRSSRLENLESRKLLAAQVLGDFSAQDVTGVVDSRFADVAGPSASATISLERFDVNNDGSVSAQDVLAVVNQLAYSQYDTTALSAQETFDVNGDQLVSPLDALVIIDHLSTSGSNFEMGAQLTPSSWIARHDLTSAGLTQLNSDFQAQGFRPVKISGYEKNGQERYAAIWHPTDGVTWSSMHGMTSAQYQAEFNNRVGQGYRVADVNGYTLGGVDYYAAVFEQTSGPAWVANHRLTSAQFQTQFNNLVSQGYRPVNVSGYAIGNQDYYTAIFEQNSDVFWSMRYGMSGSFFQQHSESLADGGFDLVDVSTFVVNGVDYYTAIWETRSEAEVVFRRGMTSAEYQAEFNLQTAQGYVLADVDGYSFGAEEYFTASWARATPEFTEVPVTGDATSLLDPVDDAVEQFMVDRQIPAGSVAISKDGQLLYEKAFGWQDKSQTVEMDTGGLFRLASVSKPITAAATRDLVAAGQLSLSDRVFCVSGGPTNCLLDIVPFGTPDSRLQNITVDHLLGHRGGWNRNAAFGDPMFRQLTIANDMGIASPPSKHDIARYMAGRTLDFTPGTQYQYSNFGYLMLGLVIEEVTGRAYTPYIQDEIFNAIGVADTEIELGRSLVGDRNPREPHYSDVGFGTNLFNTSQVTPWPDGAFHIESMDSLGGLIATAPAIARFLDEYWISGHARTGGSASYTFYGSLPGTVTMARQRPDGLNVVVLLNQRQDTTISTYALNPLQQTLDSVLDGIQWPVPAVESVQMNNGSSDRSQLTSIEVNFDADVNPNDIAGAFTLTNESTGQEVTSLQIDTTSTATGTSVLLTFDEGNSVDTRSGAHSLADGNYRLDVSAASVRGAYFGLPMASDLVHGQTAGHNDFFRLMGDVDGDRDVDARDFSQFRLAFLKSSGDPGFDARFDSDGDGDVDSRDLARFRSRFLTSLS